MPYGVLVIEDETTLAKNVKRYLEPHDYEVRCALDAQEGLRVFESFAPDIVLLDLHLPDLHGMEVLARLTQASHPAHIIVITGHGNVETAVQAMKAGAYDYLSKPLVLSELRLLLDKTLEHNHLQGVLSYYRDKDANQSGLDNLLGESPVMRTLKGQVQQLLAAEQGLARQSLPAVLITGETGVGKEVVARALHFGGVRQTRPFIELNCAALPESLLEAELFGYEPGAFTDAKGRKPGLFEAAHTGTLFLDEIGDLDLGMQAKLLKVLEDKVVRRLGGLRDRKVDVRIIAATNQGLEQLVQQGRFRADLYFRLRVISLEVAPLRQRGSDILLLANQFLTGCCSHYGKPPMRFSDTAAALLARYPWPGNVRELRNAIEQTVLLAAEPVIQPEHLPLLGHHSLERLEAGTEGGPFVLPASGIRLEDLERDLVQQALNRTGGNVTRAARLLGLSRDTLRYRLEKYRMTDRSASA